MVRSFFTFSLLMGLFSSGAAAQAVAPPAAGQPPENYRGPDTYGLCMYVAGDTSYYGNTFYLSSYFRFKAQTAMRDYATAHANGQPVRAAQCFWSYKESDLATRKETDRRLQGMPGHSTNLVETGWVYNPADPTGTAAASTAAGGSPGSGTAPSANIPASGGIGTGAASGATAASTPVNGAAANNSTGTAARSATTVGNATSIKGTAQQSVSGARTTTTNGVNGVTNSTVGGLSTGFSGAMQGVSGRLFSKRSKPTPSSTTNAQPNPPANAGASSAPSEMSSAGSVTPSAAGESAGPTMSYTPAPASTPPPPPPATTAPLEGLVADVAGNELIVNVGTAAGLAPGMKLAVLHAGKVVKDPATGKVLRTVDSKIGELSITSVDATSAVGTFSGPRGPIVGDKVRSQAH